MTSSKKIHHSILDLLNLTLVTNFKESDFNIIYEKIAAFKKFIGYNHTYDFNKAEYMLTDIKNDVFESGISEDEYNNFITKLEIVYEMIKK